MGKLWAQIVEAGLAGEFLRDPITGERKEFKFSPSGPTWRHFKKVDKERRWSWELTPKTRQWRFDFAAPRHRLLVEVDGGSFVGGAHTRGAGVTGDCIKRNYAELAGWRVLRVDPPMVRSGVALDFIKKALAGETLRAPEQTQLLG